jgi:hypothetical protein
MTLAQLLDQVAVKSGVNYWAILQTPGKPYQVSIILWCVGHGHANVSDAVISKKCCAMRTQKI